MSTVVIGMNYGHQATYIQAQAQADISYLQKIGFTRLRLAMHPYDQATKIANVQDMATYALSLGFYVIVGVTAGFGTNTITSARWSAHNTYVQNTLAPWCQANGISELCLDNEVELQLTSQITASQARSDIRTLASNVKSGGYTGKVSYATANQSAIITPWYNANEGTGALDLIGFNTYGVAGAVGSGSPFQTSVHNISANIGAKAYISEFGCIVNGYSDYNEETAWYNDVINRLADMNQELTNRSAYFFCFRDGGSGLTPNTFGIIRTDNFIHFALNALINQPLTTNTITLPTAKRRG